MKEIFDELEAKVDQNVVNRKFDEIERKNILIANDNLIADCLTKEVFYVATNSGLTVSRFTEMHDAHTVVQARWLELEAELSKLKDKIKKDDHNELVKHFSNLEVNHLNLQALDFQITQLNEKVIILHEKNELFRAENAKIKQHYKELYDSIKITHAKHKTTALLTNNENLKAQINENLKAITMDFVKLIVLAPLEEAKVEKPLDRSLASACLYTKHSQELLEYVIGTCLKDFNKRDKKHASTPLTRKTQVTFQDQCETSKNNTHKHVEQLNIQKTKVPMIPSIGVKRCTEANGSMSRSNTKKNRISPADNVNKKKVEEHPRTNKTSLKSTNRFDSSISSNRTVINSNSHSV
ncbi:hypothetical protein Tco_0931190 [Tanacetum coccineum]